MKTVKILLVLFLIAGISGVFMGCGKTTTPATAPTTTATTPAAPTETKAPEGGDKASVESYFKELKPLEEEMANLTKEWEELLANAEKTDKAELKTKIEAFLTKHAELKGKISALKADNANAKAHQGMIVEVMDIEVVGVNAAKDKFTKEGITDEEKTKLDADIKGKGEEAKTKSDALKAKTDELMTKYEIKKEEGSTGTATPANTATPAGTPSSN